MGSIRILTVRGTEYCGKLKTHDYQLDLGVNGIEHARTKDHHPQTNGICECFHKTILHAFYQVAFQRKLYHSLEELQADLDACLSATTPNEPTKSRCVAAERPCEPCLTGKSSRMKWWDSRPNLICSPIKTEECVRTSLNYYKF